MYYPCHIAPSAQQHHGCVLLRDSFSDISNRVKAFPEGRRGNCNDHTYGVVVSASRYPSRLLGLALIQRIVVDLLDGLIMHSRLAQLGLVVLTSIHHHSAYRDFEYMDVGRPAVKTGYTQRLKGSHRLC